MLAVFVGLMTLQTLVSVSSDGVAVKAAKAAASNLVPFVGGAVGDALAAVRGSIGVVKASVGTFGIIAFFVISSPVLISTLLFKTALFLAGILSELFGKSPLASLIKSAESVMSIMLSVLTAFWIFSVVSVWLLLSMTNESA